MKFLAVDRLHLLRNRTLIAGLLAIALTFGASPALAGFQWANGIPGISDRDLKTPDLTNIACGATRVRLSYPTPKTVDLTKVTSDQLEYEVCVVLL